MNLKTLRNNYAELSMQERCALTAAAALRADDPEIEAIAVASPRVSYKITDFYFLMREINQLHFINLIERWNQQTIFEHFVNQIEEESDRIKKKKLDSHARFTARLYVLITDAWREVATEIGINAADFHDFLSTDYFAIRQIEVWDDIMRQEAFTDEEAQNWAQEYLPNNVAPLRTLEDFKARYRQYLTNVTD